MKANLDRLLLSHRVSDEEKRSQWDELFKRLPRSEGQQCTGKDHPKILTSVVNRYRNDTTMRTNEKRDVIWDEADLDLVTCRNVGLPPKEVVSSKLPSPYKSCYFNIQFIVDRPVGC